MPTRRPKYDRIQPPDPSTDPLFHASDRLPNFVKGADGDDPNAHVKAAVDDDGNIPSAMPEDDFDEDLGGGVGDPSQLTAD
jgi:hypothetical protein